MSRGYKRARLAERYCLPDPNGVFALLRPVLLLTAVLAVTFAHSLSAQDPAAAQAVARARTALAPVAWMVGEWEGEASGVAGPGQQFTVNQHEDVQYGASETILMIRGTGRDPSSGATVFEAAAILWVDEQGKLAMRSHRDGRSVVADVEMQGDTLVWGFEVPGGRVRYRIWHGADDTWEEDGEFLAGGRSVMRLIRMSLRRKP